MPSVRSGKPFTHCCLGLVVFSRVPPASRNDESQYESALLRLPVQRVDFLRSGIAQEQR